MNSSQFNFIGQLAEAYIDGGTVYNGGVLVKTITSGLNQIIESAISGLPKCSVLDVKTAFDTYYSTNASYDIIQCEILSMSTISVSGANMQNQLMGYIDPHPTQGGHNLIASLFTTSYIDNLT